MLKELWSETLLPWLSVGGVQILTGLIVFFFGLWVCRMLKKAVRGVMDARKLDPTLSGFLANLAHMAMVAMLIIIVLGIMKVETTGFAAVIAAAGLAIGFALQGSLSNFAAGVMIIGFKPFKVGDLISAAGETGVVKELQIFCTIMNTPDGRRIIIPNGAITGGNITNYTVEGRVRVDMVFGIAYDDDVDKAKEILMDIVTNDPRVLEDPAPQVALSELADSSVNLVCRPWCVPGDKWGVYFDTHEAVKKRFDESGLNFPFPQQDVHMHTVAA